MVIGGGGSRTQAALKSAHQQLGLAAPAPDKAAPVVTPSGGGLDPSPRSAPPTYDSAHWHVSGADWGAAEDEWSAGPPPAPAPRGGTNHLGVSAAAAAMYLGADSGRNSTYCCLPNNVSPTAQQQQHHSGLPQQHYQIKGTISPNAHNASAARMVASYGVYQQEVVMDGGTAINNMYHAQQAAQPPPTQLAASSPYQPVPMRASLATTMSTTTATSNNHNSGNGTANNSGGNVAASNAESSTSCGWCLPPAVDTTTTAPAGPDTVWTAVCRPAFLLLTLVLLIVVFVLVSGILLYINYEAYRPRHSFAEEPCEKTFCAWGAQCITGPDGRALCQCPTQCRPHIDHVCGTDGKTYANHCEMRVASCPARLNTRVRHHGQCEQNDPCRDKQCGFGARCVPSLDGRNATCQCLEKCPRYGDHSAAGPVCGSNGIDFKNQCELRRMACTSTTNITAKFLGKCDPCAGTECSEPEVCQLDEHRVPECRCGDSCPLEFTPVCGSDGKTYSNECTLRQESCKTRRPLNIIYRGKCSSGVNPCTSVRCTLGEDCVINKYGIAKCECPPACEPVMRPVCSLDGRTYASECELRRTACVARTAVTVAYAGVCGEQGPCSEHECHHGAACVARNGAAHCECPICPAEFQPVCGSDGISYGNECKLRLEACKHRREIRVLYDGPCNGCENKKCDFHSTCESDGSTEGRCVCPESCAVDKMSGAVCGTDGVTYATECDLQKTSCKTKQYVLVAYRGDCDLCKDKQCNFGSRCEAGECICPTNCAGAGDEPVCATNHVTYASECELQKAQCQQPPNTASLTVVFYGDCRERFPVNGMITGNNNGASISPTPQSVTTAPIPETDPSVATQASDKSSSIPMMAANGIAAANTVINAVSTTVNLTATEAEACRDIHCDYEATCELGPDHYPRCTCQFDCGNAALQTGTKAVCASDLRMYPSLCAMKMEACQRQEDLRLRPVDLCQGMELKPCNGEKPLTALDTGLELDCGNGPHRQDCPSGSYCHQTTRFARCCQKDQSNIISKSCEDTWYGCCQDGKTPAQGPDGAGCPSTCGCNKLGSYSDSCDPVTQMCRCRPGVGGDKCDRCEPGYWGLPKISSGVHGCIPCGCSSFGSVRDDCEQMTGRCVCKPGIQGQKCTVCTSHDKILGPNGCASDDRDAPPPRTCRELTCHFGAVCVERPLHGSGASASGTAVCQCHTDCATDTDTEVVCGSDGQTYASACQLRLVACRVQKDLVAQAFGSCKEDMFAGTDWPIRQYTPQQFTQSDDSNSPLSKSTRHLLVPDGRYYPGGGGGVRGPPPGHVGVGGGGGGGGGAGPASGGPVSQHGAATITAEDGMGGLVRITPLVEAAAGAGVGAAQGAKGNAGSAYRPTPATVRVVTALLGDLCSDSGDCVIAASGCLGGACRCLPTYIESTDRQECIASNTSDEYRACSSIPCHHSATCVDLPSATYTCICGPERTGVLCEGLVAVGVKPFQVPAFDGHAYARLKSLKAYHKLSIEVEFQSYADDGLLLYNQQWPDGTGDFTSLAIINGHVEFRYNLGNGMVVLRSLERIEYKRFHRIVVRRYHKDAMLKMDEGEDIAGKSSGNLRALDLNEDTYIGYIPTNFTRIYNNIGTTRGLQGCIKKLKLGRHTLQLHPAHDDWTLDSVGMAECGRNPCSSIPCKNGGRCRTVDDTSSGYSCECLPHFSGTVCELELDPCGEGPCAQGATCRKGLLGGFVCLCPPGLTGKTCERLDTNVEITLPAFNGSSYIEFPRLESVSKAFTIEVTFLSHALNGLLLYNGQLRDGRGDFISLSLVHGHVQYRYNLGSGIANITSKYTIELDTWHWVRISRRGREGHMLLDNESEQRGVSGAPLTELNLELPFYIGSVASWKEVHTNVGISKGFRGALQKVEVNGQQIPIYEKLPSCTYNASGCSHHVSIYDGHPCPLTKNPCLNNGLCIPELNDYHCYCHSNFEGKYCEKAIDETPAIKFTGETFLQYKNRGYKSDSNLTSTELEYVNDESVDNQIEEAADYQYEIEKAIAEVDGELEKSYGDYDDNLEYDDAFYDTIGRKGERGNRYELKIRTFLSDGLLLWRSKTNSLEQDYMSIAIVSGHPEFSFNLGKQKEFWAIRSKTKVDDGNWHTIQVRRRKRMGYISVDGEHSLKGIARSGAISLSTNDKLWIGGVTTLPEGLPSAYYSGFEGCIQHVTVNAKELNLHQNVASLPVEFCHDNEI